MVLDFGLLESNLFPTSDASGEGIGAPTENQIVWSDVGVGIVPIGSIVAWAKSLAGTPPLLPNFVECDGSVLNDGDSPLNGQTIPDLNGGNRFLQGNATSGGTGGATQHSHNQTLENDHKNNSGGSYQGGGAVNNADGRPPYYEVVWIMRIK